MEDTSMTEAEEIDYVRERLGHDKSVWALIEIECNKLIADQMPTVPHKIAEMVHEACPKVPINKLVCVVVEYLRTRFGQRPARRFGTDKYFPRPIECMNCDEVED